MTSDKPFLLIDADVLAYRAAAGAEKIITFDDGWCFPACNIHDAEDAFMNILLGVLEHWNVGLEDCAVCFSTDRNGGFRRGVLPTYKMNREGKPRPVALKALRERLMTGSIFPESAVYIREGLEADDCLGILATQSSYKRGRKKIIVSIDKDMKTIPCWFWNIGHPDEDALFVSELEADRWFFRQTLTGDTTDGYSGCPSVGAKKAETILADCETSADMWKSVVKAYEKAGFSVNEALTQARVARILRASDYDFVNKTVKLWSPTYDD